LTSDASQRVHAQNKIKSRTHSPRRKRSAQNSRSRRRPGRAS
jgi:hypothetical protein